MRKSIETWVEFDVELDDFDDDELAEELELRGYVVTKDAPQDAEFDRYDWILLQELIDQQPRNYELDRLREKVMFARFAQ
jgi:hypothetical protein